MHNYVTEFHRYNQYETVILMKNKVKYYKK